MKRQGEMMLKSHLMAVLLIGLVASSQVLSEPISTPLSAIHLYSACNEADGNEYARGFCDGAIDALYSSIQDWCVPEEITHGEVKERIKADLLTEVPDVLLTAFEVVNRSVQEAWPCP